GVFVQPQPSEQSARRWNLAVLAAENLRCRARVIPDPDFVDRAVEETSGDTSRVQRGADAEVLNAVRPWRLADRQLTIGVAVEEQSQDRPVVRRGDVIPDVGLKDGAADQRMIVSGADPGRTFLEIRGELARRVVDPEEVVHVDVARLGLAAA